MPKGIYSRKPASVRFWEKVDKEGSAEFDSVLGDCWVWTACRFRNGYGQFRVGGKNVYAHRWAYEQEHGPLPPDLESDHLCRVRHCVRSSHIELVTRRENILRGKSFSAQNAAKTQCLHGHPFDDENTYVPPSGDQRQCRQCRREADRRRKALARLDKLAPVMYTRGIRERRLGKHGSRR